MLTELNIDEEREIERINGLADEISRELALDADYVQWLLESWLQDTSTPGWSVLQRAAAAEFGGDASMIRSHGIEDTCDAQQVLRWLAANNGVRGGMTVYRGTSGREGLPLESWTTDRDVAAFYAQRNGGEIAERYIESAEILTTWRNGVGLECAAEVIVINR